MDQFLLYEDNLTSSEPQLILLTKEAGFLGEVRFLLRPDRDRRYNGPLSLLTDRYCHRIDKKRLLF